MFASLHPPTQTLPSVPWARALVGCFTVHSSPHEQAPGMALLATFPGRETDPGGPRGRTVIPVSACTSHLATLLELGVGSPGPRGGMPGDPQGPQGSQG